MPAYTRHHKKCITQYLTKYSSNKHHSVIFSRYVERMMKNHITLIELHCIVRCTSSISKLYMKIKNVLIPHNYTQTNINFLHQFEKNIQYLKQHCVKKIDKLQDSNVQLKQIIQSVYCDTYTSLHPRGMLILLLLICLIHLIQTEYSVVQRNTHKTRFQGMYKKKLVNMHHTVYKYLYQMIRWDGFIDYDTEMQMCYTITQQPLTNTSEYGWYHADLAPYILNVIQPHQGSCLQVHQLAKNLTNILNHDESYTDTKDKKSAYRFIAKHCTYTLTQLQKNV